MLTFLIFFVLLFVLIISHECGHFFTARAFGIRVDEFGFGLPPRIKGIIRKGTLYSINWLPFGGFVKIHGEEGEDGSDPNSFASKPAWARSLVLLAGVLSNILLAYVVLSFLATRGIVEPLSEEEAIDMPDARIMIVEIAPSSPASATGLLAGDIVRKIGEIEDDMFVPQTIGEFQKYVQQNSEKILTLLVERKDKESVVMLQPRASPPAGEGLIGVALSWMRTKRVVWYKAPIVGATLTYQTITHTVDGFVDIVRDVFRGEGRDVPVAGPVGIFRIVGDAQHSGFDMVLFLTAILSVNLALINILPIPGLDGGRFAFVLAESITRRRISPHISAVVHGAGLAFLLTLMVAVTYLDISRIF
ncbi:MAG TPA: M50 family metallopeptidase [Candidatus Paceibacterota bacterium]